MPQRPLVVAFDVNETLFSLSAVERRFKRAGLPPAAVPLWFARVLRDGFALDLAGRFESFQTVARACLEGLAAEHGVAAERVSGVLEAFEELTPQADAGAAVSVLREGGVRVIALTVGSAKTTEAILGKAGWAEDFEDVVSIDDVKRWKPAAEVYRYAAQSCQVAASQLALVAAHAWDIQGAKAAGLTTAWLPRREPLFSCAMQAPDVKGRDLVEAAQGLLALPKGRAGTRARLG